MERRSSSSKTTLWIQRTQNNAMADEKESIILANYFAPQSGALLFLPQTMGGCGATSRWPTGAAVVGPS